MSFQLLWPPYRHRQDPQRRSSRLLALPHVRQVRPDHRHQPGQQQQSPPGRPFRR